MSDPAPKLTIVKQVKNPDGSYTLTLSDGTTTTVSKLPPAAVGIDPVIAAAKAVPDAIGSVTDALAKAGAWMANRHNWVRVGWVAGGGAMILIGVSILARKTVGQVAGAVVPAGKIASVAKVIK